MAVTPAARPTDGSTGASRTGADPTGAGPTIAPTAIPSVAPGGSELQAPPLVELRVEGGDPVEGQLGTYVWGGGGSDSPWLPGAPIQAATGETLSVTLPPGIAGSDWSAVVAPAANGDGSGTTEIGHGPDPMDVVTPGAGTWTLAVTIEFRDRGTATWFWKLEVS